MPQSEERWVAFTRNVTTSYSQQPLWMGTRVGPDLGTGLSLASAGVLVSTEPVPPVIASSAQKPGCYCFPAIFSEQATLSSPVNINLP